MSTVVSWRCGFARDVLPCAERRLTTLHHAEYARTWSLWEPKLTWFRQVNYSICPWGEFRAVCGQPCCFQIRVGFGKKPIEACLILHSVCWWQAEYQRGTDVLFRIVRCISGFVESLAENSTYGFNDFWWKALALFSWKEGRRKEIHFSDVSGGFCSTSFWQVSEKNEPNKPFSAKLGHVGGGAFEAITSNGPVAEASPEYSIVDFVESSGKKRLTLLTATGRNQLGVESHFARFRNYLDPNRMANFSRTCPKRVRGNKEIAAIVVQTFGRQKVKSTRTTTTVESLFLQRKNRYLPSKTSGDNHQLIEDFARSSTGRVECSFEYPIG